MRRRNIVKTFLKIEDGIFFKRKSFVTVASQFIVSNILPRFSYFRLITSHRPFDFYYKLIQIVFFEMIILKLHFFFLIINNQYLTLYLCLQIIRFSMSHPFNIPQNSCCHRNVLLIIYSR